MDDYAKARMKDTRKLTIIKMMVESGMNPMMSEVDFVYDGDLNKSLEHFVSKNYSVFFTITKQYVTGYIVNSSVWRCLRITRTPFWMRSCATRCQKTFNIWCARKLPNIATQRSSRSSMKMTTVKTNFKLSQKYCLQSQRTLRFFNETQISVVQFHTTCLKVAKLPEYL